MMPLTAGVCKSEQPSLAGIHMLVRTMVERNYGEERLARIEDMLQGLQRESAARATAIARTVLSNMPSLGEARPSASRHRRRVMRRIGVSVASAAPRPS